MQVANVDLPFDGCTARGGADTIGVPAGTYTLTQAGIKGDVDAEGDLDITSELPGRRRASITMVRAVGRTDLGDGSDRVPRAQGARAGSQSRASLCNMDSRRAISCPISVVGHLHRWRCACPPRPRHGGGSRALQNRGGILNFGSMRPSETAVCRRRWRTTTVALCTIEMPLCDQHWHPRTPCRLIAGLRMPEAPMYAGIIRMCPVKRQLETPITSDQR